MNKRFIHFALTLLFACLQCVAPLAHAHVGGGSADQRIHLHGLQQLSDHSGNLSKSSVGTHHSAAISMPQGNQGSQEWNIFQAPLLQQFALPAAEPIATVMPDVSRHSAPPAHSLKPHPQAPPAI